MFPRLALPPGPCRIHLRIAVEAACQLQLYYGLEADPPGFAQARSLGRPLQSGANSLTMALPAGVARLRLDPVNAAIGFDIRSLSL